MKFTLHSSRRNTGSHRARRPGSQGSGTRKAQPRLQFKPPPSTHRTSFLMRPPPLRSARELPGSASPARLPPSAPRAPLCHWLTCRETKAEVVAPAARAAPVPAGRPAAPGIAPAGTAAQRAPRLFIGGSQGIG